MPQSTSTGRGNGVEGTFAQHVYSWQKDMSLDEPLGYITCPDPSDLENHHLASIRFLRCRSGRVVIVPCLARFLACRILTIKAAMSQQQLRVMLPGRCLSGSLEVSKRLVHGRGGQGATKGVKVGIPDGQWPILASTSPGCLRTVRSRLAALFQPMKYVAMVMESWPLFMHDTWVPTP